MDAPGSGLALSAPPAPPLQPLPQLASLLPLGQVLPWGHLLQHRELISLPLGSCWSFVLTVNFILCLSRGSLGPRRLPCAAPLAVSPRSPGRGSSEVTRSLGMRVRLAFGVPPSGARGTAACAETGRACLSGQGSGGLPRRQGSKPAPPQFLLRKEAPAALGSWLRSRGSEPVATWPSPCLMLSHMKLRVKSGCGRQHGSAPCLTRGLRGSSASCHGSAFLLSPCLSFLFLIQPPVAWGGVSGGEPCRTPPLSACQGCVLSPLPMPCSWTALPASLPPLPLHGLLVLFSHENPPESCVLCAPTSPSSLLVLSVSSLSLCMFLARDTAESFSSRGEERSLTPSV